MTTTKPFYISPPSPTNSSHSSVSTASSDLFNSSTLPFPAPLSRTTFSTPDFDPTAFLSTLTTRFQTLSDLQSELTSLSSHINAELVDLVNENYEGFLDLGGRLRGGEERVEEVRVGLLGFERGVVEVRGRAKAEAERVKVGMKGMREVRRAMRVGRALLEWEERVRGLEKDLGLRPQEEEDGTWKEGMESSDEDEDDVVGRAKLRRKVECFSMARLLAERIGKEHPFLMAEQGRVKSVKDRLLLDADAEIRAQRDVKGKQQLLRLRAMIEE